MIGVAAGAVQGYFGGLVDLGFQRFIEIWSGLPVLYLLIIMASFIEPNFWWLLGLMLLFSWMGLVDVVRAEFLRARNFDYVRAARALGVSDRVIILRHVLPNATVATITFLPFILNGSITTLTSLDFLGFGLPPGSASLGELLAQGKANLQAPWLGLTAFFVLALMLSLLIFVGEAVRDAFDPRKVRAVSERPERCRRPLLEVRNLSVTFAGRGGAQPGRGGQGCLVHARPRRDPGAGRRERLGQERDGAVDPAAAALSGRRARRRRAASALPARSWSAPPPERLRRVRGNRIAMVFQEPMTSLNPLHTLERQIAETLLIHKHMTRRGGARAHPRAVAAGRSARCREPARRLSAPAFGRAAAAGHDRDGDRQRARHPDRRRADDRARRDDPGAHPRSC